MPAVGFSPFGFGMHEPVMKGWKLVARVSRLPKGLEPRRFPGRFAANEPLGWICGEERVDELRNFALEQ